MDKRYQVFISSTYADLQEERRQVIQTVIECDCIPAGMELFPAVDEEQLKFIKRVIDDCDYYLLIIGGKYGSMSPEGISFTEQEYDYAVQKGLKVIALIHADPDVIPLGKSEKEPAQRQKLEAFRNKVRTGRLVKFWKSGDQLPGLVALNLASTIRMYPAIGWVRGNKPASEDVLAEINDLRKQNAQLQTAVSSATPAIQNLAGLEDAMEIKGTYHNTLYRKYTSWTAKLTWRQIFGYISPYLVSLPSDVAVRSVLASSAFSHSVESKDGDQPSMNDQVFRTVAVQLEALRLVELTYGPTTSGGMGLFWSITPHGQRLMLEIRTVKKVSN
jgi:hypothetical protein